MACQRGVTVFTPYSDMFGKTSGGLSLSFHICEETPGTGTGMTDLDKKNIAEMNLIRMLVRDNDIQYIKSYFNAYINGEFDEFAQELNVDVFNRISLKLYNFQRNAIYIDYEIIRDYIITSFESLYQSTLQLYECNVLEEKYIIAQGKADILDDLTKLNEYLEELKNKSNVSFIPDVAVSTPLMTLRPEYDIYIRTYGYPEGGVFDSDLLGEILNTI
uniref:Uncharacterized protein n=1 Tax=viral metagenome TaxID=1070528 RepID=A0A6C0JDF9_9ZZZZ